MFLGVQGVSHAVGFWFPWHHILVHLVKAYREHISSLPVLPDAVELFALSMPDTCSCERKPIYQSAEGTNFFLFK